MTQKIRPVRGELLEEFFKFVHHSGNWYESDEYDFGHAWHLTREEYIEFKRITKKLNEVLQ